MIWLALASLAFYSVSNWQFVALLLSSIAFNYVIGWLLISTHLRPGPRFAGPGPSWFETRKMRSSP